MRLANKVSLITGGSRGIGLAIAEAFAAEGASVAINARDLHGLQDAAEKLRNLGGRVLCVAGDVSREDDVVRIVGEVVREFGRVDILVNNAGGGERIRNLEAVETKDYDRIMDTDLRGTFLCCREAVRVMRQNEGGVIINIASQGARTWSELSGPHYVAAKAGVLGLTRQLAKELGSFGFRVNAIAPGIVLTARVERKLLEYPEQEKQRMLDSIPLGRFGTPEDIARVAVFLASADARYITGATIDVNGGRFMP